MTKKRQLNCTLVKSKVLKHICALSNSNPANNSYIVVGVEDNEMVGRFFLMTATFNLVNAYLENPPIQYENVPFPTYQKTE
jgi:predicted HTH transcriptional regulator